MQIRRINPFKSTKSTLTVLILLAYVGLFLPIPVSNITLAVLLLYSVIHTSLGEFKTSWRQPWPLLAATAFMLLLIGLLYTENMDNGWFVMEKRLSLLLIPLLALPLFTRLDSVSPSLFRFMGYIGMASSVYLLGYAAVHYLFLDDPSAFYFERFTRPLIHYVYYAMYFVVGSLCLLDSLYDELITRRFGIVILASLFIYSLGFLILIASKTGILSFAVVSIFLLYRRLKNKRLFAVSLVALFLSGALFLYVNDTTRSRFTELTENLSILTREQLGDWQAEKITGLNMRLLFWKISVKHVVNDGDFLWGVGSGDTQDYLNTLYTDPLYNRHGYVGWDTHNEWVFTFVQVGLISVGVWASLMLIYFRKAWKASDHRFLIFLMVTFAFSMSESILESNKGIVFFALMMTVFTSAYAKPAATATPAAIS